MTFRLKTILGVAAIEVVLLLILVASALSFLADSNEKQLRQRAETTSRLFATAARDALLATDIATLEDLVDQVIDNPGVVYARISDGGFVLAEGGDISHLLGHSAGQNTGEIHGDVFDVRMEIEAAGVHYGSIEIGISTTDIEQLLIEARRWTVTVAGLEVILVAIFSFILGTYLTRQLHGLKLASETITRSGPGHQVEIHGNDEITDVARAFNAMSTSLQQSYSRLQESLTAQERMMAIADRNQAKNEAILSVSLDAIITIDQEGVVRDYNEAAERIFGWERDKILGQPMVDFIIPPHMREAHNRGMAHYLATGEGPVLNKRLQLTARHRQGHDFPVEIAISPLDTDLGVMFTAFVRDITERLGAETELRLAARAFDTSEAIIITDAEGSIIRVNDAFTEITGYGAEEVLGRKPSLLSSGRHDAEFYRTMWQQMTSSGSWRGEIYNRRKNGEIFPEYLTISAVKNPEGDTTHYVAHFIDITEQKRNEERLRRAQRDAEAANLAKSRFLATMSHEIRTPMNGVLGVLDLLADTPLEAGQRKLVRTGRESGELLLSIINDILDYSKMEADKLSLDHRPFDLHELLDQAVELLKPQAVAKDLFLELSRGAELAQHVKGDPYRLRQVLLNLVSNAIKFTPRGGVTVRVFGSRPQGRRFTLSCAVEDTGIGIPPEAQSSLFDEFTMADQSHSRSQAGTGLGLAICKRLVELMGGRIELRSEQGKGSTFSFTVEMESADAADIVPSASLEGFDRRPRASLNILLAEDNLANQVVIKSMLEHAGLRVDIVKNGREAVDAVAARPYDIVLMDISMPEMDGMAAAQAIRRLSEGPGRIPIIALTAHALAGDRERFLSAGMNDYLTKPVDREAVLLCIARWTGGDLASGQVLKGVEDDQGLVPKSGGDEEQGDPAAESVQPLDVRVLERLASETSPQAVPRMLAAFRKESELRVASVVQHLSPPALDRLQRDAHSLKSSAGTFGALELQHLALDLEEACRRGDSADACEKAHRIPKAWQRVSTALDRYLSEKRSAAL